MNREQQFELLRKNVGEWNAWRNENPTFQIQLNQVDLTGAGLNGANLRGANLANANLSAADLRGANLREAILRSATLNGASLSGASLSGARLTLADLIGANLSGTDLTESDLGGTNLSEANLRGASLHSASLRWARLDRAALSDAVLGETIFSNLDLSNVIGLETCRHHGPSVIDHRTLMRGQLPLPFLRGCGLSDNLIEYLPSLRGSAIDFYSCFISYSTQDEDFAMRLHADLQGKGVRCWFAPHDISGGKKIHQQIDEAIRVYDKLLLILSSESMRSNWVRTEIANARKRELKENRRMLFPIRLVDFVAIKEWQCFDADTGIDSAREIREFFIPDFSRWKGDHDVYTKAFDRLLKDLRTEGEALP
jgi:hypothetical protein